MARMLDMIKQSSVPANLMRTAAKGALALPAPEMVEIGAGRELFVHGRFSMHVAWIRKQAARRTCGQRGVVGS